MGFSNKHSVFSDKFVNDILNGSINYDALEPRANVTNSAAGFNIEVELPGFKKTEIQVEAKHGLLTVVANRASKSAYTHQEFGVSSLRRSWTLPKTVNVDAVDAAYDAGILTLTLPYKAQNTEPDRKIEIR